MNDSEGRMSFFEHLEELRSKLLRCVLAIIVGFGVGFYLREHLFNIISEPMKKLLPPEANFVIINPGEAFFVQLKLAFVFGLLATFPYIVYQMWLFVAPGLYRKERKLAIPFVVVATALFYIGSLFAYFLVFPVVFKFFIAITPVDVQPMIAMSPYVSLANKLIVAFGIVFETPIIIVFLGLLGIVNAPMLKKGRRYFVVLAFVIGAIFSPPDILSQIMMGLPLLVLFEISIQVMTIIEKRRKDREDKEEAELYED